MVCGAPFYHIVMPLPSNSVGSPIIICSAPEMSNIYPNKVIFTCDANGDPPGGCLSLLPHSKCAPVTVSCLLLQFCNRAAYPRG